MASVFDVATEALNAVGSNTGNILQACVWVTRRYHHITRQAQMRHLREIGELVMPAQVIAGTITATQGSATVTGDATAQAAWSSALVGRYFRTQTTWYRIAAASTTLTLDSTFAEATTTGASYAIVARLHTLNASARWLGDFKHQRLFRRLENLTLEELNSRAASRNTINSLPLWWVDVGTNAVGTRQVEIYPAAANSPELIQYEYWTIPENLALTDTLPPQIDVDILRDGVLIDVMRYEMSEAMKRGDIEQAALWRNEYRAQTTSWNKQVRDALRTDHGKDDATMVVKAGTSFRPHPDQDLITAYDAVWNRDVS